MSESTRPDNKDVPAAQAGLDRPPPALTPVPSYPGTVPTLDFAPSPPRQEPTLPEQFGRYTIQRRLGRGGMGSVYLARDTQLDRLVALKVPQLEGPDADHLRQRFVREARAAALLHHPNICPVYDVGDINGVPFLTMAYIEGQPLHEWARPLRPVSEVLALVRTLALALEEAHQRGVIHRDLKPSNILVDQRGEPVIMDFGLARRFHLDRETRLTSPGILMGTPAYMPPEHVLGQEGPSVSGDVYSLGVILYELLTGQAPFQGSVGAILARIVNDEPLPPSRLRHGLSPRIDDVCRRAMAKSTEHRFASMAELARGLSVCLESLSGSAPREEPSRPPVGGGPDPRLAPKILETLRTWGWARGVQKIRNRAQRADDARQRSAWQGILDWMVGDRTADALGVEAFQGLPEGTALRGWALAGRASFLMRQRDYQGALKVLEKAEAQGDPADAVLRATIAHTRAAALAHQGRCDQALPFLHQALDLFGQKHFVTGRVLDTLGMAYAYKGNFPVAREFYEQSIRYKAGFNDEAGIAISHGQLGRLHLDWGHLDDAEKHFQEDLRLAQKIRSRWSEAQIYNHLGQVALARGEREAAAGRKAGARRRWAEAAGWLDESIRHSERGPFPVSEGFARKDRARVYLCEGNLDSAEHECKRATELFQANDFAEGVAKVHAVEGMILRARERCAEADRKFRSALSYFEATQERDAAVRMLWEIARTLRDCGASAPLVTRAYREALTRAEDARHAPLVRAVEEDLREVDFEAYLRHIYRRARGYDIEEDTPSLLSGNTEAGTVLLLDLPGFAEFSQGLDGESVLVTFNQLMADFSEVLSRHQGRVTSYRGNGVMALMRDARHAERAVQAALDLVASLEEFNRPRQVLGLALFHLRIGINTGDVLLGNVGTYDKMDFTAIGATVNLAGALRNEAEPGLPCISRPTYELVRERFVFASGPRTLTLTGFGPVEVWDVSKRRG
jgi:class 3 adenylate cyclase/predicted Ser/Thr protein kinase/Flp pilus assembly protein TadD